MKRRAVLGVILLGLLAATASSQTPRLVPSQYPTIQAAIAACIDGDTVWVANGVYYESIDFVGKAIHVIGAYVTTIQGAPGAPVVKFTNGEGPASHLYHITVTGGAGIFIQNSSPTIQNCRIVANARNGPGGGVLCQATGAGTASPHFFQCTIENNLAIGGGGAGLAFDCPSSATSFPTMSDCVVSSNAPALGGTPGPGGGLALSGNCDAAFTKCRIEGNSTSNVGGGVFVDAATASFTSCRFLENQASIGGGLYCNGGNVSLTACLIAGNSAQQSSGAFRLETASSAPSVSLLVKNCTIAGNSASAANGGIGVTGTGSPAVTLVNTIVWGNTGTNLEAPAASVTYSDVSFGLYTPGPGTLYADPRFLDAANGDYHLATSSPCRDAGDPNTVGLPTLDLDGATRLVGSSVDMGSDEIPALLYPGTADGLDLYRWSPWYPDPLASVHAAAPGPAGAGKLVRVLMKSSTGSLVGGLPLLAVEIYPWSSPPVQPPGFPTIWLDGRAFIVYGTLAAPPMGFPGLPPEGLEFDFAVPVGLDGHTARMQGLVQSWNALYPPYAISNATEVVFTADQ